MAIFKCKMCGGDLEILENATVCECEFCGTKQTVPTAKTEAIANLFNRANKLRIKCEFDKAEEIYEKILGKDETLAEAHWGLVLCKYGIEYVEDPATETRVPTCHRASYEAVTSDTDYLSAVEYADSEQKKIYKAEAKVIEGIQKRTLEIVKNEKPFDVFICYKETDKKGKRTVDSTYANDIYHQLTNEGFKVFYAAITLEDKLGQEYEPYIFAALNSAKVMLVIGSKEEYFNAIWVKNEWSRFLKLMKTDRSKLLIPCYKDIDPYDLPEEFAHLQAQDMGKIGFINDIVRGIKKVVKEEKKETTTTIIQNANDSVTPLLKRVFMFLEDGEWSNADEFCEKVLNIDPENPQAYLGKLMVELQVKTKEELENCAKVFNKSANYQKIVRFGDEELVNELNGYIKTINSRNVEIYYNQVVSAIPNATRKEDFEKIIVALEKIEIYKDSAEKIAFCKSKIDELRKADEEAERLIKEAEIAAEQKAEEERKEAEHRAEIIRNEKEKSKKKRRNIAIGIPSGLIAIVLVVVLSITTIIPKIKFNDIIGISAGSVIYGLKQDGSVVASGDYVYITGATKGWTDIVAISAGYSLIVGLKSNGTVVASEFSNDEYRGQCDVQDWTDIIAISASMSHTVGLKSNGTVVATEYLGDYYDEKCDVQDWTDIVAISAGIGHTVGLKSDGTVVATGCNGDGECNVSTWTDIVAISADSHNTVGLKSDGTVVATGYNGDGKCDVSTWTDIVAISAGNRHTVGLKSDGTVVATGYNGDGECDVSTWTDIVAISAGQRNTVGLKSNGTVVATETIL